MSSVKKIWENKAQIIEGMTNVMFKKAEIEKVAAKRLEICKACPLFDTEGTKCLVPGTAPCCGDCGCKLSFKTRALSASCTHPDGPKWTAELEQEQEDKLYNDINYNPDDTSI